MQLGQDKYFFTPSLYFAILLQLHANLCPSAFHATYAVLICKMHDPLSREDLSGVPQGSLFGPFLFVIFVKNLQRNMIHTHLQNQ